MLQLSKIFGISPSLEQVSCAFRMSVVKRQKREGSSNVVQRFKLACQSFQHYLNLHSANAVLKRFSLPSHGKKKKKHFWTWTTVQSDAVSSFSLWRQLQLLHASSYLFQDIAEQMLTRMSLILLLLLGTIRAALKQGKNQVQLKYPRTEK